MKNSFVVFLFLSLFCLTTSAQAQDSFSKIKLSGYKVNLIQSDAFKVEVDTTFKFEREIADGVLSINVIDQTGRVPKSTITIFTNKLEQLDLHNSELVMNSSFKVDSLSVVVTSAFGLLKVNADYLNVLVQAGSNFSIEGTTSILHADVGSASSLSAGKLLAKQAELNVMGYSNLVVNAKEVTRSENINSKIKNVYKK